MGKLRGMMCPMDPDHPKVHDGGRPLFHQPRKLTLAVQEVICEAMDSGATLETAARAASIGARTLDAWLQYGRKELQENPNAEGPCAGFVRAVTIANAECEIGLLTIIQDEAPKTWQAAAWLLERKYPKRYARVDRLRVSGDEINEKPVTIENREEAQAKLHQKLAKLAESALDKSGKNDIPVINGEFIEADDAS